MRDILQKELERLVGELNKGEHLMIAQAKASEGSFKDEFLCIIFCIPLIMCFIPGFEGYAIRGFEILATMPEWYQAMFGVIVAASFGFRGATKFMDRKKG